MMLGVTACSLLPGVLFPNVARGTQAVISIGEELGMAGSNIAQAGANVTRGVAFVVTSLTNTGASLVDTAWEGVDLADVEVKAATGRLFAMDVEQLREALFNEETRRAASSRGSLWTRKGCGRRC